MLTRTTDTYTADNTQITMETCNHSSSSQNISQFAHLNAAGYEHPQQTFESTSIDEAANMADKEAPDHFQNAIRKTTLLDIQQKRGLPEAMSLLSTVTKDIERRVNILLSQHEDDFFSAFRSHALNVQRHIEKLQECANAQKNLMTRDLKIKTLQQELQWFVEESVRLDQICKRLKGDLIGWQARTAALREDRDFLEKELKETRRKLRRAELNDHNMSAKRMQNQGEELSTCLRSEHSKTLHDTVDSLKRQIANLTATIHRLQNDARRNSRRGSSLVEASKALGRRQHLERFLVECINDVKKERKLKGIPTASLGEFEHLSVEEFLAFDRRKVLNALLSNDNVLRKLYCLIFPHKGTVE
ncbi:myosin heavy [Cyclospora cayetanensis]|nr:myosin heavy [Cyclospora cayetanensis]